MPELPEVETVRRGLQRCLPGRTLRTVELRRPDLRWPMPAARLRALCGMVCDRIERRSKYLLLHFRKASTVLVHLGMSGRLSVEAAGAEPTWERHEHWRMAFDGQLARFVDPRRFGVLDVIDAEDLEHHKLLVQLGPEPLGKGFTPEFLFARTRGRTASLKAFLMDARNVVGVGNIYASEACFGAGLRPTRAAGRLTRAQCGELVAAVRKTLEHAIRKGGTTLRDYIGVDGDAGFFQRELMVYGRDGEPCRVCGTIVRRVVEGARSTFYCPKCQRV
jgi:formamidopyrimidine-DNA glycosylase